MTASGGGFNGSAQHLLVLLDQEVSAWNGRPEYGFPARRKAELWERWKSGQYVADIARALGRRNIKYFALKMGA
jgi:hypothetical protein